MKINLENFSISSLEKLLEKKEKKCVLYCDFNVANILFEQNLQIPQEFIVYPDSSLIYLVLKWFMRIRLTRIVSTELLYQVLNLIEQKKLKLYLFGNKKEILETADTEIKKNYSNILLNGYSEGYNYNSGEVIKDIQRKKPDIILVGLGVGRQEKWLIQNFDALPPVIVLSVGGLFNYLSGLKKRAPSIFLKLRLEWMYRLLTEFNYVWKKYSLHAIKFLYRTAIGKIKFSYRYDV